MDERIESPIRWVGGKGRLLDEVISRLPIDFGDYYEPFVGGASVCLNVDDKHRRFVNDANEELINFYRVLSGSCEELIRIVSSFEVSEASYYEIRKWDRDNGFSKRSAIERAARFLFLNRTCFNGVWRINEKHGYNNVPWGKPKAVNFQIERLRRASRNLSGVTMANEDFEIFMRGPKAGDFVYLDPPYVPLSPTASFTGYVASGFSFDDQRRLKTACDELTKKGVRWLQSNSSASAVYELYEGHRIEEIAVRRLIGGKGAARSVVNEVLISNH